MQFSSVPKDYENFGLKIFLEDKKKWEKKMVALAEISFSLTVEKRKLELDLDIYRYRYKYKKKNTNSNKLCITNVLLTHCHFLIQLKNVCFFAFEYNFPRS